MGEEGDDNYNYCYTVTTGMTTALRLTDDDRLVALFSALLNRLTALVCEST